MKHFMNVLAMLFAFTATSFSQAGTIPELIFQNPVLKSGTAGQDGAIYKFSNVASGIDATVKIKARSGSSVKLSDIDVADMGWGKAFQPQLGIEGNVPANQNWWMDFEMRFYVAGTTTKKVIQGFQVTAIDVDGDGVSIREYLQMHNAKSVTYCPVNYLAEETPVAISEEYDGNEINLVGTDKRVLGPVQNFYNIDTAGTPVMSTYKYENKDMITFRYGAKSGSIISNAGERLNSLWFKAFTLTPPSTLPITFYSFTASYDKKNTVLNWSAQSDDNLGHFIVEKSTDGVSFKAISQLPASNANRSYSYTDAGVTSATGMVYYRILSKEKTGEVNYSAIKTVRLSKDATASISVYPNPVIATANLTLPQHWQSKAVLVSIYNGAGALMKSMSIKVASQTETLDFQHLSRGIYVVKAQCNDESSEQRILRN